MKKRSKYYLTGLLALAVFIFGYHFYAAYQAEIQIDETIREQVEKPLSSTSLTYSSIDVSPFSGDIRFDDMSFVDTTGMLRSRSIRLDLGYGDFLNIYFRGLQYGMEQIVHARVNIDQPSYVDRSSFREIKFNSLDITFNGNAWNAMVSLVNSRPAETQQSLILNGESFIYHIPGSLPGTVKAESFDSEHLFPANSNIWLHHGRHRLKLNQITWTPTTSLQEQYGFFIKGFGYETDKIPADSLRFSIDSSPAGPTLASAGLFTSLFDARISSQMYINPYSFMNSRLKDGTVEISNTSEQFNSFLKNLEQLLGRKISEPSGPAFRFEGTLNEPRFTVQPQPR